MNIKYVHLNLFWSSLTVFSVWVVGYKKERVCEEMAGICHGDAMHSSWMSADKGMTNASSKWSGIDRTGRGKGELGESVGKLLSLSLSSPFPSHHGNMPGGHSREASSLTKTTERGRVSEGKREQNRQCVCACVCPCARVCVFVCVGMREGVWVGK